jgi:hypothetical protein
MQSTPPVDMVVLGILFEPPRDNSRMVGLYEVISALGIDSGRVTGQPEVIPGQTSSRGRSEREIKMFRLRPVRLSRRHTR